jgi:hypothetical protein
LAGSFVAVIFIQILLSLFSQWTFFPKELSYNGYKDKTNKTYPRSIPEEPKDYFLHHILLTVVAGRFFVPCRV